MNKMNQAIFLRKCPLNDEQIWMHSLIEKGIDSHCVLVLIEYRIDLLLFFPTNRTVPLLLKE
jgi:hypothetical protein